MPESSPVAAWKPIPGWEGWYEVSDTGLIRSVTRTLKLSDGRVRTFWGQILKPQSGDYGHQYVRLCCQQDDQVMFIHVAMMAAFVGPKPSGLQVCHNDGDCCHNRLSNLRYDTPQANTMDNVRNGTHVYARRDHCKWLHLLEGPNLRRTKLQRVCVACHKAHNVISAARTKGRPPPDFHVLVRRLYSEIMAGYEPPVIPAQRVPIESVERVK